MEVVVERCAGLDVHKDTVMASVRIPGEKGAREQTTRGFGTTTKELLALRDWLVGLGVTRVGMESTGIYWRPVYYVLEEVFECWLLNARHMRNVPGRKTDVKDAEWIAQLMEHGLVRPSFVPPKPIRELRNLTRYRRAQAEERTREVQRLDKVLQDAGIKLSSVATDILGKSGRDMLLALVAGRRDADALAELARGKLRGKIPALKEALEGRFGSHHALLVSSILAKLDFLETIIDSLSEEVGRVIEPYAAQVKLLDTIPGVDRIGAEGIVAEIGVDMAQFGSAERLASWAGMCPGNHESAGKQKSGRSRKGSKWLGVHLTEAATSAGRTKDTYLGAQYQRLRGRRGAAKAKKAVGHSILVAAYHMLDTGTPYRDLGADWFAHRRPEAQARKLIHQLNVLGYTVSLSPIDRAA